MPQPASPKPLHIFRAGTHTAADGRELIFSEADLAATAKAYDPALHEAPIVVGHPAHNAPAYGWVSGLVAGADGLRAAPRQVDPSFAESVAAGRFKKISASFYHPQSPANPAPGVFYLRHVGFLGAMPPAVKGLAQAEFAGGAEDFVTVEFGEEVPSGFLSRLAALFRGVRDYIIDKDGLEAADKVIPSWAMDWLQEDAAKAQPQEAQPAFAEHPKENSVSKPFVAPGMPPARVLNDPGYEARLAALEQREVAFMEKQRRQEADTIVQAAIGAGRLTAAQAAGLVEFMVGLPEDGAVSFAEGNEQKSLAPSAFVAAFLSRLPVQVEFAEKSAPNPMQCDGMSPKDLADRATAYRTRKAGEGVELSFTEAVHAVRDGKDQ
jgi:hypothetical protein